MPFQFDHRQLADEMEIFFIDEQIGAGLPIWLPNGVAIRDALESFVKDLERRAGYQRVVSPHLARAELYEKSGHLRNYKDDMYPPMKDDESEFYLKPMNCPHHHKIFASSHRSFRQLPLKLAEYAQVYRHERSGSLRGLSRVRGLCQNDAHIYLEPGQVVAEVHAVLDLHEKCYRALDLKGYRYRLSLGDPSRPEVFEGPLEIWKKAESLLREVLVARGAEFFEAVGEAAFYGPKIDVQMQLASGQEESIASVQVDFLSAERFDLSYVASSGEKVRPWIIHRAPLGSHERFVSLLLEYYDGRLPGWLAPIQLYLVPVSENLLPQARELASELVGEGIRVKVDENQGSLSKRILAAHRWRPFAKLVLGEKELRSGELKLQLRESECSVSRAELVSEMKKRLQPQA